MIDAYIEWSEHKPDDALRPYTYKDKFGIILPLPDLSVPNRERLWRKYRALRDQYLLAKK